MITPGLAYAIGYQPYRLALVHAVEALLARLARCYEARLTMGFAAA